jgi:hypothetical protein
MAADLDFILEDRGARYIVRINQRLRGDELRADLYYLFEKIAKRAEKFVRDYTFKEGVLKYRTGDLSKAIQGSAAMVNRVPTFRVGVSRGRALRYAETQERGREIEPVRREMLAIPARGGPAVTAAREIHKFDGPRDFVQKTGQQLVFIPSKSGRVRGVLFRALDLKRAAKAGASIRSIQAVYILMDRVKIPAHYFLRDGLMLFLPLVINEITEFFEKRWED